MYGLHMSDEPIYGPPPSKWNKPLKPAADSLQQEVDELRKLVDSQAERIASLEKSVGLMRRVLNDLQMSHTPAR
jgi:hypothetical protein